MQAAVAGFATSAAQAATSVAGTAPTSTATPEPSSTPAATATAAKPSPTNTPADTPTAAPTETPASTATGTATSTTSDQYGDQYCHRDESANENCDGNLASYRDGYRDGYQHTNNQVDGHATTDQDAAAHRNKHARRGNLFARSTTAGDACTGCIDQHCGSRAHPGRQYDGDNNQHIANSRRCGIFFAYDTDPRCYGLAGSQHGNSDRFCYCNRDRYRDSGGDDCGRGGDYGPPTGNVGAYG